MKKKPKTKVGPKGLLYAIKTKRAGKGVAWMPDEVAVSLEGEKTGRLLINCGWSISVGVKDAWPIARIESNLDRLAEGWAEDFGKGWKLEIRPL